MAGIGKYKGEGSFKMPGFGTKAGLDTALNKNGGYHKGQVNDAETEEMNDNIAMGDGPAKPKSVVSARPNTKNTDETLMAADGSTSTAPTFSDFIDEAKNNKKDPDTKKAKKINKKLLG